MNDTKTFQEGSYKFDMTYVAAEYFVTIYKLKRVWFEHLHGFKTFNIYVTSERIKCPTTWLLTNDRLSDNDLRSWCYNWIKDELSKSNKN